MRGADLTFGPPGNEWYYERSSRTYDLTRGQSPSWSVGTTKGPAATSITVAPHTTALVIVDMQNFFLHPSCRDHPAGLAAVEPTKKVVEKCRELGVEVIWLNWGLNDDDLAKMPAGVQRGFSRPLISGSAASGLGVDLGEGKGRCLVAETWNADIYEPLKRCARPEDVRHSKNRMSGMWSPEQPLWKYLKQPTSAAAGDDGRTGAGTETGKRTLLFAGVNTDQCVLGTLTDAYNGGWDCVMIEDCCATTTPGAPEVCLYNVATSYGFVINSETFLAGTSSTP